MIFLAAVKGKDVIAGLLVLFLLFGKVGGKSLFYIDTQQEIEIGKEVCQELEKQYGVVNDPKYTEILQQVGPKVASMSPRQDVKYEFKVLKTNEVNAMAVPGGFIYVTKGLMDYVNLDKNMLAFVIGHEVGHITARHSARMIEREMKSDVAILVLTGGERGARELSLARDLLFLGYGRNYEFEADRWGVILAYKAGFDPEGAVKFFQKLLKDEKGKPSKLEVLFRSHPPTQDRLARVEEEIRKLKGG